MFIVVCTYIFDKKLSFKDAKLLSRIISKFILGTLIYDNDNDRVSFIEHCIATVSTSINFSPSLSQVPSSLLHDILSTQDNFSVSVALWVFVASLYYTSLYVSCEVVILYFPISLDQPFSRLLSDSSTQQQIA